MNEPVFWLTKLILAHLLTDFILQPTSWIESRNTRHFASPHLYAHGGVTTIVALLFIGFRYWPVALIVGGTHVLIDGWKSYRGDQIAYFLIDQALHVLVIGLSWYATFFTLANLSWAWNQFNQVQIWIQITATIFLTAPAGIFIGQATKKWRNQLPDATSLASAGKWIGFFERVIIFVLVLNGQYEAIGLLIAAKSIIRFSDNDRTEIKTEYLLIGTLISISLAVLTGLLVVQLIGSLKP
jgi:hypothetical protein